MMIDGKTEEEIMAMPRMQRKNWYKSLLSIEKERAMKIVETARRAKLSVYRTGRVSSEEVRVKGRASWTPERRAKMSAAMTEYWRKFRARMSRRGLCQECGTPLTKLDNKFCSKRCGDIHWRRENRELLNEQTRERAREKYWADPIRQEAREARRARARGVEE